MPRRRRFLAVILTALLTLGTGLGAARSAAPPEPYRIATGLEGSFEQDGISAIGDRIFWVSYGSSATSSPDSDLWTSDGTAGGTKEFFDPRPGGRAAVGQLHSFRAGLVFVADDGVHGRELWTSDGTSAGTRLVADLSAADEVFGTRILAVTSGAVFLTADDGTHGSELYRWTGSGTPQLLEINATPSSAPVPDVADEWRSGWADAHPADLGIVGETLYLHADNTRYAAVKDDWGDWHVSTSGHGRELWRVGTTGSPALVKDITTTDVWGEPDPTGSTDFGSGWAGAAQLGGSLYFVITRKGAADLWRTDGTAAGTTTVATAIPVGWDTNMRDWDFHPVAANDRLYYSSWSQARGHDGIWSTTGTGAGARVGPPGEASGLVTLGGKIVYSLGRPDTGDEPWVASGTTATLLKDIRPGAAWSNPFPTRVWQGHAYFGASAGAGRDLYRTDGTAAGTILVHDLANTTGALVDGPVIFGGAATRLYFFHSPDGSRVVDNELWAFDPRRVTKPAPVVTVKATSPVAYGRKSSVTITVSGTTGVPTGRVTLKRGATVLGSANLSSGKAAISLPATLRLGSHPLTATYAGNATYAAATSTTRTVVVKAATKLAGRISAVTFPPSTRVKVSVRLTTTPGIRATGTMRLRVDGRVRATRALTTAASNRLTFTAPKLTAGTHTLQVRFTGSPRAMDARTGTVRVQVIRP